MIKLVIFTSSPNGLLLLKKLQTCLPSELQIAGVVVCADKRNPHFFGQKPQEDQVAQYCIEKGIDLYFNPNDLKGKTFDLGLSFSNFFILKKEHIDCFRQGIINFHGAPINRYRGSASTVFHLLNKDEETFGYSYHFMTPELDKGDILHEHFFNYESNVSSKELDQMVLNIALEKIPLFISETLNYFQTKRTLDPVRDGIMPKKRSELFGLELHNLDLKDEKLKILLKAFDWPQIVEHPQIKVNSCPVRLVPEETYQEMLQIYRRTKL